MLARGFESSGRDFPARIFRRDYLILIQLNAIQLSQLGLFREFTTNKLREILTCFTKYIYRYILTEINETKRELRNRTTAKKSFFVFHRCFVNLREISRRIA